MKLEGIGPAELDQDDKHRAGTLLASGMAARTLRGVLVGGVVRAAGQNG